MHVYPRITVDDPSCVFDPDLKLVLKLLIELMHTESPHDHGLDVLNDFTEAEIWEQLYRSLDRLTAVEAIGRAVAQNRDDLAEEIDAEWAERRRVFDAQNTRP